MHNVWWKRALTCFLGTSCRGPLQHCRKILSPINRMPGGNKKQQESWRRGSSETRCGLHWTTESTVAISARASGIITPHGTAHIKGNQNGRPTLPPPLVPTSAFAPSFCLFVPADVATRLDSFGHHRAACAEEGVLGRRGFPLECAAAQVCCEPGARVATNVLVRDVDLAAFNALDSRRLEVDWRTV